VARLLSPRVLEPNQEYITAIVPAFNEIGADAWSPGVSATLPCYHSWLFRTGEAGDFKTLAADLQPGVADPELGRAPLSYHRVDPPALLSVRGALSPIGGTDAALDADVADDVEQLLQLLIDPRGRPVITLPRYGEAWTADPMTTDWGKAVNGDPRHRGTAGLGSWAGIELQEQIMDAAAAQVGALDIAAQRIRHLTMGLGAVRSLWTRRLPEDPGQRLLLYGPSLRRMMTTDGPVLDQIAGGDRPLAPRLFSSAARRVLRPGPARTAHADPQATFPSRILEQANTCPLPPPRVVDRMPHADQAAETFERDPLDDLIRKRLDDGRLKLDEFVNHFLQVVEKSDFFDMLREIYQYVASLKNDPQRLPISRLIEILNAIEEKNQEKLVSLVRAFKFEREEPDEGSLLDLGKEILTDPPDRPCRPVDLEKLEEVLTGAIDPTVDEPLVQVRVLSTIEGLDPEQPLAPVEVCLGIDFPVWTFLRDRAPDWLLPGVNQLEENAVVGMESNPVFVDAFLLGLNTQILNELRWRNMHVVSRCTPMRMFWGQTDAAANTRTPDIRGVDLWPDASELGDPSHQPPSNATNDLVLVFKSDIFRRYPRTLVYAAPAPITGGGPDWDADPPFGSGDRLFPTFQGSIGEDIAFFRFDIQPEDATGYWIVLEEPPSGYTFRNDVAVGAGVNNGADFADITFSDPIRVLIRGESLIPGA
jgi:hypothetical protein